MTNLADTLACLEHILPMENRHHLTLKEEAESLQQEARMMLPGIQAIFGFQLIAVFNDRFVDDLSRTDQLLHLVAIIFTICTIILTLAPAAYHREAEPNYVSQKFVNMFNRSLCRALLPLSAATSLDVYVIADLILKNTPIAIAIGVVAFSAFIGAWYVRPRIGKISADRSRP